MPVQIVTADQAYDDSANHEFLAQKGIDSAICLHGYRTQKKDPRKEVWERLAKSPSYQQGLQERYQIERKFGKRSSSMASGGVAMWG